MFNKKINEVKSLLKFETKNKEAKGTKSFLGFSLKMFQTDHFYLLQLYLQLKRNKAADFIYS